jgi:hypothetical protein
MGVCRPPLGIYHRFVDNKWLTVLYIQILVDDKGLARVYIQGGIAGTKGWKPTLIRVRRAPPGVYHRFAHNKGVAVLYIQILADGKGLTRVYIQNWKSETKGLQVGICRHDCRGDGRLSSETLNHAIEFFQNVPPAQRQGQARSRAPVYQAVSILSGRSTAGCVRRHLAARISICGSPSHTSEAR